MKKKLSTSTLGLLAVLALVSACGKNSKTGGGDGGVASSVSSSPISGSGISQDVTNLYNQVNAMNMNQIIAISNQVVERQYTANNNNNSGNYSILNGLIQFNYNLNLTSSYTMDSGYPKTGMVIQLTDANNIQMSNAGVVNKTTVLNRMFRPDLGMIDGGDCNGAKSIVSATINSAKSISSTVRAVDFMVAETCAGSTVMHIVTNTIDLNYPLIANPKETVQGKYQQQNNSSFSFVAKKARTLGPY